MIAGIAVVNSAAIDMLTTNGMFGLLVGIALTASLVVHEVAGPLSTWPAQAISRLSWAAITPLGILFTGILTARIAQAL